VTDRLKIQPTSRITAKLDEDIVISDPDEVDSKLTRRVLRATLVDNPKNSSATIQAEISHQRRGPKTAEWRDAEPFNPATLKAGQEIRMRFTAGQTRRLYDALTQLYMVLVGGWERDQERQYSIIDAETSMIVSGREREILETILDKEGPEFWSLIEELQPGLMTAVAIKKDYEKKQAAVREFQEQLEASEAGSNAWTEGDWEQFFRRNTWIFGYNLIYQFVRTVVDQPQYAAPDVFGDDSQRGDILLATEAQARFTVLVDLKKPDTPLLHSKLYRNQVYYLSAELIGGIAQLQSNTRNWEIKAATDVRSARKLDPQHIYTYEPRSILIAGNLASLDDDDKRSTFQLFRRNLAAPEIITYDELLKRAEFALELQREET
jgi:hypothetical protein